MSGNSCFSKIIAPFLSVNTHTNAPDQQSDKTSGFIEVLTPAADD